MKALKGSAQKSIRFEKGGVLPILLLRDPIIRDGVLRRRDKAVHALVSELSVLGFASGDPLSPPLPALSLQVAAHEVDHLLLRQPELRLNRLKRRAVFPRHADDAVCLVRLQVVLLLVVGAHVILFCKKSTF